MRTVEIITQEIENLKAKRAEVRGTETEVYTRIVGYYRSLRNWNKGKRQEYAERLPFVVSEEVPASAAGGEPSLAKARSADGSGETALKNLTAYRYFYRKNCPNCPPVRDFVNRLPLAGQGVDVDTEDGLSAAVENGVQSTPTVVFYNNEGRVCLRGHSLGQLQQMFANAL